MSEDGVRLLVRSRRVPTRIARYAVPVSIRGGLVFSEPREAVVYDYVLEEEQRELLDHARHLAESLGVRLEVIDTSRENFVARAFRSLLGKTKSHIPSVELATPQITTGETNPTRPLTKPSISTMAKPRMITTQQIRIGQKQRL